MRNYFKLPLSPKPQTLSISLAGVVYKLRLTWNSQNLSWQIDIADASGNPIISGIPLVTGTDLLAPYAYMNFGGALVATTDGDTYAKPTYQNLGAAGKLLFVTP